MTQASHHRAGPAAGSDRVAPLQRRSVDLLPLGAAIRTLPGLSGVGPLIAAMRCRPALDDDPEHRYLRDVTASAPAHAAGAWPVGKARAGTEGR